MAPTISRRSTAIGCRRAMVRMAFSSTSCCSASIAGSVAMTRSASSVSRSTSEVTASASCRSTKPPISATLRMISCRSVSNALAVWSILVVYSVMSRYLRLSEAAGDVVLRALIVRRGEHLACRIEFEQFTEIHERCEVRDTGGLFDVLGDDHDRVVVRQFIDQFFDLGRRDRIECRAGL